MKESNSFDKEWKTKDDGHWFLTRLRIYDTYLILNCGGKMDEALPIIDNCFAEINAIAIKGGFLAEPCRLELNNGSSYLHIMGLDGFATQAGYIFVGMLIKDGWFVQEFQHEVLRGNKQPMIDMMKKSR